MHIIGIRLDGGKENVSKTFNRVGIRSVTLLNLFGKIIMNGVSQDQWPKTYIRPVIHCQEL